MALGAQICIFRRAAEKCKKAIINIINIINDNKNKWALFLQIFNEKVRGGGGLIYPVCINFGAYEPPNLEHPPKLLRTKAFTHQSFYAPRLLRAKVFTHQSFYVFTFQEGF